MVCEPVLPLTPSLARLLAILRAILLAELWPHSPAESIKGGFRIISDTIRAASFQVFILSILSQYLITESPVDLLEDLLKLYLTRQKAAGG